MPEASARKRCGSRTALQLLSSGCKQLTAAVLCYQNPCFLFSSFMFSSPMRPMQNGDSPVRQCRVHWILGAFQLLKEFLLDMGGGDMSEYGFKGAFVQSFKMIPVAF